MAIDWRAVQRRLAAAGYAIGAVDGVAGARTFAALLAWVAARRVDDGLRALATALWAQVTASAIVARPARLANFLAQGATETGGYRRFVEDMRYSAAGMMRTWPTRITSLAQAQGFVGRPEALANFVYARPEMGNVAPGDGWRYRGRGWLQTTFRANYARVAAASGLDVVAAPELLERPAEGIGAAILYWADARVDAAIDAGDFVRARRLTNGGTIGLGEVMRRQARAMAVLAA